MINYETPESKDKKGVAYYEAGRAVGRTETIAALEWAFREETRDAAEKILGIENVERDIFTLPVDTVVETIKAYRAEKDYKIGDIVRNRQGTRIVITSVSPETKMTPLYITGINENGGIDYAEDGDFIRTGEHIELAADMIRALKGADDGND